MACLVAPVCVQGLLLFDNALDKVWQNEKVSRFCELRHEQTKVTHKMSRMSTFSDYACENVNEMCKKCV